MTQVPKVQIMYACTIGVINFSHSLFKTKYGDQEMLEQIAENVKIRLNSPNPFTMDLQWECDLYSCPNVRFHGPGWQVITLDQWAQRQDDSFPIPVPNLPPENAFALIDMSKVLDISPSF